MRLFRTGGRHTDAKVLYEVVPLVGGGDARINSERLKKARINVIAEKKERRHRGTEAPRLGRPTEHQDTEARKQLRTQPRKHEADKTPRHEKNKKNKKKSRVFWTEK